MIESHDLAPSLAEITFLMKRALHSLSDAADRMVVLQADAGCAMTIAEIDDLSEPSYLGGVAGGIGTLQLKPPQKPDQMSSVSSSNESLHERIHSRDNRAIEFYQPRSQQYAVDASVPQAPEQPQTKEAEPEEKNSEVSSTAFDDNAFILGNGLRAAVVPNGENREEKEASSDLPPVKTASFSGSEITERNTESSTSREALKRQQSIRHRLSEANEQDKFTKGRQRGKLALAIWTFLEDPESSTLARYFSWLMNLILQVSVMLSVLQTVTPPPLDMEAYSLTQVCIDLFFLGELILRLLVCPSFTAFAKSFYNITDFVAAALPLSIRSVQTFSGAATMEHGYIQYLVYCVAPVLRELKMLRRVQQFHLFLILLDDIKEAVLILMMLLVIVVLLFSGLIYTFEPNVGSLPKAMYAVIVTVTTVGYGDITPETAEGTVATTILTLFSVLYTAMPIGIIGNAFTQIWNDRHRILLMIKTRDIMLQSGYTAKDLPEIFKEYASAEDEQLSFENFLAMVKDMNLPIEEHRVIEVYESIDRDGGGSIDEQEFIRAIFPDAFHEIYAHAKDDDDESSKNEGESPSPSPSQIKARSPRVSVRQAIPLSTETFRRQTSGGSERGSSKEQHERPSAKTSKNDGFRRQTSAESASGNSKESSRHPPKRRISVRDNSSNGTADK
eukprot:TRINITY_DN92955_c0_g1_i1.p1 TRINITY_DN92955_c0_g1~~TRINITY_DN92955_c0_g1_i1.p1  ORF type:complete len:703 (+),score=125.06 TRINITY_DN92955_c0_g1_i1:96-2111(+)